MTVSAYSLTTESGSVVFQVFVKIPIPDQGDFDRLYEAVAAGPGRETCDEVEIVHDRKGHGECTDPILFPKIVDPVFDPDAPVSLAECRGGHTDEPNPAVGGRGTEPREVQKGTSSDGDHVGMTTNFAILDRLPYLLHERPVVFANLSPGEFHGRGDELERVGVGRKIPGDLFLKSRIRFRHSRVNEHENFRIGIEGTGIGDKIAEGMVRHREGPVRESNAVLEVDRNRALDHGGYDNGSASFAQGQRHASAETSGRHLPFASCDGAGCFARRRPAKTKMRLAQTGNCMTLEI